MDDIRQHFHDVMAKTRKNMEDSGEARLLEKFNDTINELNETGIPAFLETDRQNRLKQPRYFFYGLDKAARFILNLDGAEYGVYLGRASRDDDDAKMNCVAITDGTLTALDREDTYPVKLYDFDNPDDVTSFCKTLINTVAPRMAREELLPGATAKNSRANVRKTKSPVRLGQ